MLRATVGDSIAQIQSYIQESGDVLLLLVCACFVFVILVFCDHQKASILSSCFAMAAGTWFLALVRDGSVQLPSVIQNRLAPWLGVQVQGGYEGEEDEAANSDDDSSFTPNVDDAFEPFDMGANSDSFKEEGSGGLGDISAAYSSASLPPNFTVVIPNGNTGAGFRTLDGTSGEDVFDGALHINSIQLQETMRFATEGGSIEILTGADEFGGGYGADDGLGSGRNKARLDQLFRYMATMDARNNEQGATPQRQKLQRKLLQRSAGAAAAASGGAGVGATEADPPGGGSSAGNAGSTTAANGADEVEDVLQDSGKMEALLKELGEHGTMPKAGPSKRAKPKRSSAPRNSRGGGGSATSLKEETKQQAVTAKASAAHATSSQQHSMGQQASSTPAAAQPRKDLEKTSLPAASAAMLAEPAPPPRQRSRAQTAPAVPEQSLELQAVEDFEAADDLGFSTAQLGEGFQVVANRKARRKGRQRGSSASEVPEGSEAASDLPSRDATAGSEVAPGATGSVASEPARPRSVGSRGGGATPSAGTGAPDAKGISTSAAGAIGSSATVAPLVRSKPTRAPWAAEKVPSQATPELQSTDSKTSGAATYPEIRGDAYAEVDGSDEHASEAAVEASPDTCGDDKASPETSSDDKAEKRATKSSMLEPQQEAEDPMERIPEEETRENEEKCPAVAEGETSANQAVQGDDGEWDEDNDEYDEDWEWQCPSGYRLEPYTCPRPMLCSSCGEMQPEGAKMLRSEESSWAACEDCLSLAWEQDPIPPSAGWSEEVAEPGTDPSELHSDPARMSSAEIAAWFKAYGAEDALRECMKQVLAQASRHAGTSAEAGRAVMPVTNSSIDGGDAERL